MRFGDHADRAARHDDLGEAARRHQAALNVNVRVDQARCEKQTACIQSFSSRHVFANECNKPVLNGNAGAVDGQRMNIHDPRVLNQQVSA